MSDFIKITISRFNSIVDDALHYCNIARDAKLQNASCNTLKSMLAECSAIKQQAVEEKMENFANILLGFENLALCLWHEITMWLLLKEERPDEAWDHLVDAQMCAANAARAHDGFSRIEDHAQRLLSIEKAVFPPQVFMSAGMVVRYQECSLCGSEYGECEHVAGKPYWGKFCSIVAKEVEFDHTAVVKDPADKSCRVTHFYVGDECRNRMTWKAEKSPLNNQNPKNFEVADESIDDEGGILRVVATLIRTSR